MPRANARPHRPRRVCGVRALLACCAILTTGFGPSPNGLAWAQDDPLACAPVVPLDLEAPEGTSLGWRIEKSGDWVAIAARHRIVVFLELVHDEWIEQDRVELENANRIHAISLDVDRLAVGYESTDNAGSGRVAVLRRDETRWIVDADLAPWDTPENPEGFAMDLELSGATLTVAHPLETVGNRQNAGKLYFFRRIGTQWLTQTTIAHPEPTPESFFGRTITYNAGRLLVVAENSRALPGELGGSQIYVYSFEGGEWIIVDRLRETRGERRLRFTGSIAIEGDWLAASATDDPGGAGAAGAGLDPRESIHLYRRTGDSWRLFQSIDPTEFDLGLVTPDGRATSLAISNDRLIFPTVEDDSDGGLAERRLAYYRFDGKHWSEAWRFASPEGDASGFASAATIEDRVALIGSSSSASTGFLSRATIHVPPQAHMTMTAELLDAGEGADDRLFGTTLGTEVVLDARTSDPGEASSIDQFEWGFGDGSRAFEAVAAKRFSVPGSYEISLDLVASNGVCHANAATLEVTCTDDVGEDWSSSSIGAPSSLGAGRVDIDEIDGTTSLEICAPLAREGESESETPVHLVHRLVRGNFDVDAAVERLSPRILEARAGLTIRASLDGEAAFVSVMLENRDANGLPDDRVILLSRSIEGGPVERVEVSVGEPRAPAFRLAREGDLVNVLFTTTGASFDELATLIVELPLDVEVGGVAEGTSTTEHGSRLSSRARLVDVDLRRRTPAFVRGDTGADGELELSDAITLLTFLFRARTPPRCLLASDVNLDGGVDLSDAVFPLSYLFLGGPPPPAPFPDCGTLPREEGQLPCDDELTCS